MFIRGAIVAAFKDNSVFIYPVGMMATGIHGSYHRKVLLRVQSELVHELFVRDPC